MLDAIAHGDDGIVQGARSRGDANGFGAVEPGRVEFAGRGDVVDTGAVLFRGGDELARVVRVVTADHDDEIVVAGEFFD